MHLLKYNGVTSAGIEMASVHAEASALTADETSAGVHQPQERRKPGDLLYKDTNGGIMYSRYRTINPEIGNNDQTTLISTLKCLICDYLA